MDASEQAVPLPELFGQAWLAHSQLEANDTEGHENEVLSAWKEVELQVTRNNLFSPNETLEDVQTASIRYLLIPYFMGEVALKTRSLETRLEHLKQAESCFTVFLMRLERLGAMSKQDRAIWNRKEGTSVGPAQYRNEMISRAKEVDPQLKSIEEIGKSKILLGQVTDEEQARDLLKMLLSCCCFSALRELNLIRQELPLLEMHMRERPQKQETRKEAHKPLASEREELMRNVFRYANPPTMSVEEAGEIEFRLMQERQARQTSSKKKASDADEDDEDALRKQREWDDWKDDNPRGWGNRMNQG